MQTLRIAKMNLIKRKNKRNGNTLEGSYYLISGQSKVIVIKTEYYWSKSRQKDSWIGIERPGITLHI